MTPSSLRFCKMHGLGNDFVVIDAIHQKINRSTLPVQVIADRHLGVGCDQLLLIESSVKADFFCRILNADGSEAEQCGNGLRAIARYVHEHGLHDSTHLSIETVAGIFPVEIQDYDHIRVTIASAGIAATAMEISLPELGQVVSGSALSMGNPHFIIKVTDVENTLTNEIGSAVATHSSFPQGTNVGFMQVKDTGHIILRTYERGAGETFACGSNACAAVAAGILDGSLTHSVLVEFQYGSLTIAWEGPGKPVHMTGPASSVFTGEWASSH